MPYFMDFRGRMYPQSRSLSLYGRDFERSLFVFYKKKLIGEEGLYNLKIYFSTILNGNKFLTNEEHIDFCDSFKEIICQTATNPKDNIWWLKHDKAFQILAVCKEIFNASKDPLNYASGFPIFIDATSSSFQHVAALTRNDTLAKFLVSLSFLLDLDSPTWSRMTKGRIFILTLVVL